MYQRQPSTVSLQADRWGQMPGVSGKIALIGLLFQQRSIVSQLSLARRFKGSAAVSTIAGWALKSRPVDLRTAAGVLQWLLGLCYVGGHRRVPFNTQSMVDTPDTTELLLHPVVDRCTHWTPQVDTLNTTQFVFLQFMVDTLDTKRSFYKLWWTGGWTPQRSDTIELFYTLWWTWWTP